MRTLIKDTVSQIGKTVTVKGWVNSVRSHGQIIFIDLRDRSGLLQVVGDKKLADLKDEYVVEITGTINPRNSKYFNDKLITGQVEMAATEIKVISAAQTLPFDIHQPELNVSLPILLDYRAASLRHSKVQDVFKVQATITEAFRSFLSSQGFTEFHAPTIVATPTEGGSQVFPIDYFGYRAFLGQSPQFYKQIMVSIFERVFTIAHAYRAEPSVTTRHITEYVGLDCELGFIDSWLDVLKTADAVVKAIFKEVETKNSTILKEYNVSIPQTVSETPYVKLKEAQEIIFKRTGRDIRSEPDMDPEGEREICRWSLEEHGSEMVFITHFPTKKRPWYTFPDPENPNETLGFDLIGRGVEWITGGQRINNYDTLRANIAKMGANPDDFEIPYLQAFKYGMPPEGGFCIGLERITQNILGLENIRQASLYPRDMERIDNRLSIIGRPFSTDKSESLHDKLISFLTEKQIVFKHLEHQETKTSQDSSKVRGTRLEQGAKALLMFADNHPILAVLSAAHKLDNQSFKKQFEFKDLRLASPQEVLDISSVPIGAVPPLGNLFQVQTFFDQELAKEDEIAFNAGSLTQSIIMRTSDFISLVKPRMGNYAKK